MRVGIYQFEWWHLVAARFLWIPLLLGGFAVAAVIGTVAPVQEWGGEALVLIILAPTVTVAFASLAAPYAVYRERKSLPKDGAWYPSRWYYVTIFPTGVLGFILSIVYTYRRRKYVDQHA